MKSTVLTMILTLGVAVIAPVGLVAEDSGSDPVAMLVGAWTDEDEFFRLEFKADGTAIMSAMGMARVGSYTATAIASNQVEVTVTERAEEGHEPMSETTVFTFVNDKMRTSMGGNEVVMSRAAPSVPNAAGETVVDATSMESLMRSLAVIRHALSAEEQERYDAAFNILINSSMNGGEAATAQMNGLDGKTGQEVMEFVVSSWPAITAAGAEQMVRHGIAGGMHAFQLSGHNDEDGDDEGEYGFLPQLAGTWPCFGGRVEAAEGEPHGFRSESGLEADMLSFIDAQHTGPDAEVGGYRYVVYLPDGRGGAVDISGFRELLQNGEWANSVDQRETWYVAYAFPAESLEVERPVFATTAARRVYKRMTMSADQPAWTALYSTPPTFVDGDKGVISEEWVALE